MTSIDSTQQLSRDRIAGLMPRRPAMLIAVAGVAATLTAAAPRVEAAAPLSLYAPNLTQYPNASASSPRVITLFHSGPENGTLLAAFDDGNTFTVTDGSGEPQSFGVYRSADHGATWSEVSVVPDAIHGWKFAQQPMLFEVPKPLGGPGGLTPGTILLVGNYEAPNVANQDIEVYKSTDHGRSWSYLSSCVTGGASGHGTWEPYLALDANDHLNCYFSDERQNTSGYSQIIGHVSSSDGGRSWGAESADVGVADGVTRPGMAAVVRTYGGQYVMAFETVGETDSQVHIKVSKDGAHWGDESDLGTLAATSDGYFLGATPELIAIPPSKAYPMGELVLGAKVFFDNGGNQDVATGNVVLVNTTGGAGSWSRANAPLGLDPAPTLSPDCNNYKPGLAWTGRGSEVIELTPRLISPNVCGIVYGRASVAPALQNAAVLATAVGPDSRPWVLWRYPDNRISAWVLTPDGSSLIRSSDFEQKPGWSWAGLAIGVDNKPRVLWNEDDGAATVWTLSQDASAVESACRYVAPSGTAGQAIAVGPDGRLRILWSGATGQAAVSTMNGGCGQPAAQATFPALEDWTAFDIAVGTDNEPRLLWNHSDGAIAIWTQTADASSTLYNYQYGPFGGPVALGLASGPDNQIRVLWSAPDGPVNLWTMDSYGSTLIANDAFGPFQGASVTSLGIGGNNEPRLLWNSDTDFMDFWTMSPDGGTLLFNYSGAPSASSRP